MHISGHYFSVHISNILKLLQSIIFNKLSQDTEKYKWLTFTWNEYKDAYS